MVSLSTTIRYDLAPPQLFLQDAGHLVEIAHNGVEAFVTARNLRPMSCSATLRYPMNGYAIARTIRQDAELKNVYLIDLGGTQRYEDQQFGETGRF